MRNLRKSIALAHVAACWSVVAIAASPNSGEVAQWLTGQWTKCLTALGCDCGDAFEIEAIGPDAVRVHSPQGGAYSDWDVALEGDVIEYRLRYSSVGHGPELYRERIVGSDELRPLEAQGPEGTVRYAADEWWGRCR